MVCCAGAPPKRGAQWLLLLLLYASVGLWGQAAAAGGAIFTGRIDAYCVSEMMVAMLTFAMVRSCTTLSVCLRVVARGGAADLVLLRWVAAVGCAQTWEFVTRRLEVKVRTLSRSDPLVQATPTAACLSAATLMLYV